MKFSLKSSECSRKTRNDEICDFGPPSPSRDRYGIGRRDLIGKYLYRGDVSEKKPVEIWLFKTGLGQGLRPSETGFALME